LVIRQDNTETKRSTSSLTLKVDEQNENYGSSFNEDVQKKIKLLGYY